MSSRISKSRGQIAVVMALAVAALLGVMALSTDVGLLYYHWGLLQNAADSAVLAGATYLPSNPTSAVSVGNSFAAQNGISASEVTSTTVAADQMSITVHLSRRVPYYFALMVGLSSGQVEASATAGRGAGR